MRRVVSLLHRQAVRAKAEGLFFKESTAILRGPAAFPYITDCATVVDFAPLQIHSCRSNLASTRPAIQGSRCPYQLYFTPVFQGNRERCLLGYRGGHALRILEQISETWMCRRSFRRIGAIGSNSRAGNPNNELSKRKLSWTLAFLRMLRSRKVIRGASNWALLSLPWLKKISLIS